MAIDDAPEMTFGGTRRAEMTPLKGPPGEPTVALYKFPDEESFVKRVINPERRKPLPTYVFWDETVGYNQQVEIKETMVELFESIGLDRALLEFYGNWREEDYKLPNGNLKPHAGIEWQIKSKVDKTKGQINADSVVREMSDDPYQITSPHWEVIFTNEDMMAPDTNFVIGCARPDLGTIISLKRLSTINNPNLRKESIKTEIFHEVGHVFNLPDVKRSENIENSLGPHCTNYGCSMKQGLRVPQDWETFTKERVDAGGKPFCGECTSHLKEKYNLKTKS